MEFTAIPNFEQTPIIGASATIELSRRSESQTMTIPAKCLHSEDEDDVYFVYTIMTYSSALRKKSEIIRVNVEVLENNGRVASIQSNMIMSDTEIVLETSRHISPGSEIVVTERFGSLW